MKMKKTVLLLVLAMIAAGSVFAQEEQEAEQEAVTPQARAEKTAYIKPTWGFGFSSLTLKGYNNNSYTEGLFALALDVDFVTGIGLSFGVQTIMAWSNDIPATPLANFGLGYTYTANVWSVGAKFMSVPLLNGGLGFDINGTYWFNRHIGITGIMDIYFTASDVDWSLFSMRLGISGRF